MIRFLCLCSFFLVTSFVFPQSLANYTSIRNTGITYSSISASGNSFPSWRNTGTATQDDNRSDFTNIGFDFWYRGTRYTRFCVSTNGFIDFSPSTDDGGPLADDFGYDNTAFTNSNPPAGTWPAIAPFYDDLTAQGGTAALGTSIKYLVSGAAPNRTLTIEWINMAVYLNTTPSLNFQVQLMEGTGQVIINYGVMNTGTKVFSYSMGMNIDGLPTLSNLKALQTVNTNVFSNNQANNLSAMPAANSQYILTSPLPSSAPGSLSFSAITSGGMTLNWTNLCTNEVGYVIYNSTDGTNYSFVSQTAANATSAIISNLLPNTNYFWRVYSVTEGYLSAPLSGTQATIPGQNKISTGSGNWGAATTWTPSGVPTPGDNATIANGHVVSINVNANCNALTVGQGAAATLQYLGSTPRILTTNSVVTINSGAAFNVNTNSNVTHSINIRGGNIVNNGIINFFTDGNSRVNASFVYGGNVNYTGTGTINNFNNISLSLGTSNTNTLDIAVPSFSAATNFLTLTNGTFKISSTNTATLTPFSAAANISQSTGLCLNAPNITCNTGANVTLIGNITLANGTLNIGNAANEDLIVNGGDLSVSSGVLNVSGKLYTPGINSLCSFNQSGGSIIVPTLGSTNTTNAPFQITGVGSTFNMSGGAVIIPREGGSGAQDLGFINTGASGSVTGGTLQLGTATTPAGQTLNVNSSLPVGNLSINSANVTAKLITNTLSIINNLTNTGAVNSNSLNISIGGNWLNSGAAFVPGNAMVTFSSNLAQSIVHAGGELFNHLVFSGSGIKTFSNSITANGNFSINTGSSVDVGVASNSLAIKGNYLNNGTFNARLGLVHFNGTTAQTLGGSSITNFYDITLGNSAGASLTGAENLLGTLTLTTGVFDTNSQIFTMVSTATASARIAEITGTGDITGNVTVQRFAPGGTTGWALFGTPISSPLTLNDWDDDMAISCPTCPDGSAGGFLSIYTYDENAPGLYDAAAAYIPLSTINDPIIAGQGYWVYFGNGQFTTTDITIDVTGTVRKFNYNIPLNYTNFGSPADDGWNLVHNPYPSPISWSALKGATANVDNAFYVYNPDLNAGAGGFASFVNGVSSPAVGSGGVGNTIPMSQGFYVHSTGATALNGTEAIKVAGNPTYLKSSSAASANPLVRLTLNGVFGFKDETVLYLETGATDGFDIGYDAYKLRGQDPFAPIIALRKANDDFQINGVAPISGNFTMPLKTITGYTGTYTISASSFSTFPSGACIHLYDKFTNITTDLKTNNYIFNLSDTTTVARFDLNITLNNLTVASTVNQPSCSNINGGYIIAAPLTGGPWNYYWTSGGSPVKTTLNKTSSDTLGFLNSGNYDVEINTVGMCDNKNLSYQVNAQLLPVAQFNSIDTLDLNQSLSITFNNTSSDAISYFWDFGDGVGTSTNVSPVYFYTAPGTYTVMLISTSNTGCNDTAYKVITVTATITELGSNGINPADLIVKTSSDNEFVFEQTFSETQSLNFRLYDTQGRLLVNYGTLTASKIQLPVNLKSFAAGIYLMNITTGSERRVVKLPVK